MQLHEAINHAVERDARPARPAGARSLYGKPPYSWPGVHGPGIMGFGVPPHANATMSFELACTGVATSCKFKILARSLRVDVTSLLDILYARGQNSSDRPQGPEP